MLGADGVQKHNEEVKIKAWELMEGAFQVSVDTDLGLDYDDIESRIEYYQNILTGILTNDFKELNKRLGAGFLPGTLSVILAASGVGKSLLMTALISDFILQGKNVLLVSMEMSSNEIVKRVDANVLDIDINELSSNMSNVQNELFETMSTADLIRKRYQEKKDKLGKFYTKQYAPGQFSAMMLEQLLNSYETEKDITFDVVFLDYLGIMKSDRISMGAGLYNYVKAITEEVRAVSVNREIPIISASQLNRCLHPDTKILTTDGEVKVKNININDKLVNYNNSNTVTRISKSEGKMYKIKTKSGREIICSGNHKFPTSEGTMTVNVGLEPGLKLSKL